MLRQPFQLPRANISAKAKAWSLACISGRVEGRKDRGTLRGAILAVAMLWFVLFPGATSAQEKLSSSNLSEFLKQYDTNFSLLDGVYRELGEDALPLRDEKGHLLGHRPIEDRRQSLSDLRQSVLQLGTHPQDLVIAAKLVFKTETLADDLFDLSQIAYDNDREELGKHLEDLQLTMDHNKEVLAAYLLDLAAQAQDRIVQLEKDKAELERKLKEAAGTASAAPRSDSHRIQP